MTNPDQPSRPRDVSHNSEQLAYNRAETLRWVANCIAIDPSGWQEACAALAVLMSAMEHETPVPDGYAEVVHRWPCEAATVMAQLCRVGMDAAWVQDRTIARASVEDGAPMVAYVMALATLHWADVPQAKESMASMILSMGLRDLLTMTKYAATSLSLLDITSGDVLTLAALVPDVATPPD